MTYKRRVLSALGKEDLLAVARALELDVSARMSVDDLRDVIAKAKGVSVGDVVTDSMSRDTLKAICEACGLEPNGRDKQGLVQRILDAARANGNGNGNGEYVVDGDTGKSTAREGGASFALTNPTVAPTTRPITAAFTVGRSMRPKA